jgi:uncharacterized protein RhaS with RHS repeats
VPTAVAEEVIQRLAEGFRGTVDKYTANRYYNPATAQFLAVDPRAALTESPYGYVRDNPLNGADPSGLDACVNADGSISGGGCYHDGPGGSEPSGSFTCVAQGGDPNLMSDSSGQAIYCGSGPLATGTLRGGSCAEEARNAAEGSGYFIPDNYVPERAANDQGWVFRGPGTTGNANIVRVGEPDAKNATGYVRYYNRFGQPLDALGNPGPDPDTHLPLRGDGSGGEEVDPFLESFSTQGDCLVGA